MIRKFPFVSRKRFEKVRTEALANEEAALAKVRTVQKQRDEALETVSRITATLGMSGLYPIAVCRDQSDWSTFCSSDIFQRVVEEDRKILARHQFEEKWELTGYSIPAHQLVNFETDMRAGGAKRGDLYVPNLRERLTCQVTNLNNRQRLVATLLASKLSTSPHINCIYLMEQVTPIFNWANNTFRDLNIIGSEYLGDGLSPGAIVDGIQHEDLQRLSFEQSTLDLVVSNDVMEHVPSPPAAFRELARVMRPSAQALMTFPFSPDRQSSVVRAEVIDGAIVHHCEPIYHSNPISAQGSLVFTDFGWDVVDLIRAEGFADVVVEFYHAATLGHFGTGLLVFRLTR